MTRDTTKRPPWCPHPDCSTLTCVGEQSICTGRMPREVPHGCGSNTHRLCLNNEDGTIDLMIHSGDAFFMRMALGAVIKDKDKTQ